MARQLVAVKVSQAELALLTELFNTLKCESLSGVLRLGLIALAEREGRYPNLLARVCADRGCSPPRRSVKLTRLIGRRSSKPDGTNDRRRA